MSKKAEIKLPLKRYEQQDMNESGFMYQATKLIIVWGALALNIKGASDDTIPSSSVDEKYITKNKNSIPSNCQYLQLSDNLFLAELSAIREFIPNRKTIRKFHKVLKDTLNTVRFKC